MRRELLFAIALLAPDDLRCSIIQVVIGADVAHDGS